MPSIIQGPGNNRRFNALRNAKSSEKYRRLKRNVNSFTSATRTLVQGVARTQRKSTSFRPEESEQMVWEASQRR